MYHFRLKHAQQELKKKESDLKKTEQGYKKDKQAYDTVVQNLKKLEVRIYVLIKEVGMNLTLGHSL